ncbi:MAG: DMT family transporter [Anaerolineales bacterium]|nr:DMT family transporter [Anaerolineales bacterium]
MNLQALMYVVFTGMLYATAIISTRFSLGQFDPLAFVALRLLICGVAFVLVFILGGRRYRWPTDRATWKHGIIVGVLDTALPMTLFVSALQYQSSGVASILISLFPALIMVLAHFFLPDERLNAQKLIGVGLALSGAVLLVARGETGLPNLAEASPWGYILTLTGITTGSFMTIYARKYMSEMETIDVVSVRMWTAMVLMIPISLFVGGWEFSEVTNVGVWVLLISALIGTFLPFMTSFYILKQFGATTSSMTTYVTPVATTIGGALILHEIVTIGMLWGMLLIVAGIIIVNRPSRRPKVYV